MNQAAAAANNASTGVSIGSYATLTTMHLALVALLAVAVLVAVVHGIRLKHRRVAAEQAVVEHAAEAGVPVIEPAAAEPSLPADRDGAIPAASAPAASAPAAQAATPVADEATVAEEPPVADERIAAAAPLGASPAAEAAFSPGAPTAAQGPVTQIKGLGPKVAARLATLGITTVGQIAALSDDEAAALDARLESFQGRLTRDRWVEQARFLAAGDRAGFEAVFGRL